MVGIIPAFALFLTFQSSPPVVHTHVAVLEVNHYHDEFAKPIFTQLIFYDEDGSIIDYRILKRRLLSRPPHHSFYDLTTNLLYDITADSFIESWTQYDPEMDARDILPLSERRLLPTKP